MNISFTSHTRYQDITEELVDADEHASNQWLLGGSIIALISVPISLFRFLMFGWSHIFWVHLLGMVVVISMYFFRYNLKPRIKLSAMLTLCMLISVTALFKYGLYGNGVLWGFFMIFVALSFMSQRMVLAIFVAYMITYLIAAYGFISGQQHFPGDPVRYLQSPLSWILTLVTAFSYVILGIVIETRHKKTIQSLIMKLETKSKQLAMVADLDALTSLPNLRVLKARVEHLISESANNTQGVLFYLDLDGFKKINDNYGHDAGDAVLKTVANALLTIVRSGDIVARIGGDEFVILLSDSGKTPLPQLESFAQRIIDAVNHEIFYKDATLRVGTSIGITHLNGQQDSYDAAIKRADLAMYEAKKNGKNGYRIVS